MYHDTATKNISSHATLDVFAERRSGDCKVVESSDESAVFRLRPMFELDAVFDTGDGLCDPVRWA